MNFPDTHELSRLGSQSISSVGREGVVSRSLSLGRSGRR